MEQRGQLHSSLRFARQWTRTSTADGGTGASPLHYPSRHTESLSPPSTSRVAITHTPDTAGRRRPLESSFTSASPSPARPSDPSAHISRGASRAEVVGPPLLSSAAQPAVPSPRTPLPTTSSQDEGRLFWRRQAQRLEASCAAMQEELNAVYRLARMGDVRAVEEGEETYGGRVTRPPARPIDVDYDAVVDERNKARLELAREREKNFLLRHRLRETEAELRRVQRARSGGDGVQRFSHQHAVPTGMHGSHHSRHRHRSCSPLRASAEVTHRVPPSPTSPHHRSNTVARAVSSSWDRREPSVPPSSRRAWGSSSQTRSSTASASASSSRSCRGDYRGTDTAVASVALPRSLGAPRPLRRPSHRSPPDADAAAAHHLLSTLMHRRVGSSPAAQRHRGASTADRSASSSTSSLSSSTSASAPAQSPPRRLFHSDLFDVASPSVHVRRLLSPTPPQRASDDEDGADVAVVRAGRVAPPPTLAEVLATTRHHAGSAHGGAPPWRPCSLDTPP
ncbi:hypothetical protein NESM_000234800 [Novymonas esmeraldas]|uniref:Uncharacterized protein n=1 Tax=Novymonas esmeraldas TaxID=1808958 RepID=A0AAW0F7L4_9TRYP